MIITVATTKGGVGKSTITMNLALGSAKVGISTAIVDTDEQRSCIEILQGHDKKNLTLYEITEEPHNILHKIRPKHEIIFVDTPPHTHLLMRQAIMASDLAILPLQPSILDIKSMAKTVKDCLRIQKIKAQKNLPMLRCYFLVNRINPRTILGSEIRATLGNHYPFPIFKTMLHSREIYKQSLNEGQSVFEYDRKSQAAEETKALLHEVIKIRKALRN